MCLKLRSKGRNFTWAEFTCTTLAEHAVIGERENSNPILKYTYVILSIKIFFI